ncbi:MAG: ATP-binding protein [Xenococcaceae cyanobacterium]
MNSADSKFLIPNGREFVIVDRDLIILEKSKYAEKFAEFSQEIAIGCDIRAGFPELIGIEDILDDILMGNQVNFSLQGINRSVENSPGLYLDLSINRLNECLIIWLEDSTKLMILEQFLIQRANDAEVLLGELTISKDYLNKILRFMGDALIVTSESAIIKQINQTTEELFGFTEAELLGKSILEIVDNIQFLIEHIYDRPLETETFFENIELNCQTRHGRVITIEFSCVAVRTDIRSIFDYVYIGRDMTKRKLAEEENLKALQKAREVNHLKSRFLSMASHEFGGRLTSILLCLNQLGSGNLSLSEKNFYLDAAEEATQRMKELVEDTIDLGKVDSENISFKPKELDLLVFCRKLIQELTINRAHCINFQITNDSRQVILDANLLHYILSNLLGNALKYSAEDTSVDFKINRDRRQIIFIIQDRGIGIPTSEQQFLFESFYRADNVGDVGGSGLGLSIVKKAIDLHGGEIAIESELGVGTTAIVKLPV